MTEKRYVYNVNKNCIECNEKFVAYVDSIDGFRIANKMNVLQKENEQLKKQIDNMAFILRQNGLGLMEDDD